MRLLAAAVLALAMVTPACLRAASPPEEGLEGAPAETFAIDAQNALRMTIDVTIGNKGPFPFIVDTGAPRSAISRDLARTLALKKGRDIKLHTMTGADVVETAMIPELAVNTLKVKGLMASSLSRSDMGAAGILGIDALQSRRVLMNFRARTMTLTPSLRLNREWRADFVGETIIVSARQRFGQLIITQARVGNGSVDVLIDTGLEVSIGNEALRRRLFNQDGAKAGRWQVITLEGVTGDTVQVDFTTVDRLRVANMEISNLPLAFANVHPFAVLGMTRTPALILGMDVLRYFDQVSLDYRSKEVGFRWSERPRETPVAQDAPRP